MTIRYFRWVPLLAVALAGCLTVSAAGEKRRAFGPEWKKVDSQFAGEYEREVRVKIHHGQGNVAGFQLPLECGDYLWGNEIDDNAGSSVELRSRESSTYAGFEVTKNPQGKPESVTLIAGPNRYFDLDADGMIDATYDNRGGHRTPMILFEGRFVPVEDSKVLFRVARGETIKVWGVGRTEAYEFKNGRWSRSK